MAVPLVLHAGMHKTGTTAIQRFLADGLSDPRFCHVGCGLANASRPLHAFVSDSPHKHPSHRQQGLSARAVRRLRLQWQTRWWQQLAQARDTGVTPIVSAEDCCVFSGAELQRLRALIEAAGHRARVIVYLRSPRAWLSSMLKELLKNAQCDDVQGFFSSCRQAIPSSAYLCWDYRHQLQALATVFGTDQLTVRHFHPDHLKAGCVVADFCDQFGLAPPAAPAPLVNAGLSLDACRLLHAYNLSLPTRGFSRIRPI